MDLTVPGGMGGYETVQRLLALDPQVRAIVSSGYSNDPILANFRSYGFAGVIAKPYQMAELGKVLEDVIAPSGVLRRKLRAAASVHDLARVDVQRAVRRRLDVRDQERVAARRG